MPQDTPEAPASAAQEEGDLAREPALLEGIEHKPLLARLGIYTRLSGPGWLQSAITLGSGSLSSSLFLGMLVGFSMMWLQPLAMILGVVMLSAIGYVALSTGERPFRAVIKHVSPVLGWSWAIGTALANVVWCLPQFSVGVATARQNLLPSVLGPASGLSETAGKLIAAAGILGICVFIIWFYDQGRRGIRIFEWVLKGMVGVIIACFFGVVVKMSLAGALDWGAICRGIVPDFSSLSEPAKTFSGALLAAGEHAVYWSEQIVRMQRDVMISAFATAVGINMTFLLPYSMLAKGWRRSARGLAIFDLSTGLFVPFILATGCVVIASASQFHTKYHPGLVGEPYKLRLEDGTTRIVNAAAGQAVDESKLRELSQPGAGLTGKYSKIADGRVKQTMGKEAYAKLTDEQKQVARDALPQADRRLAAMLVKRSAFDLAGAIRPLTGKAVSHWLFGIGVLGMAISSIVILMLISGFVVCEMLGLPARGNAHRVACLLPAVGVLGPFLWTGGRAQFWLAMPTSIFCGALIPIAYWSFFCLMNSKSLLGENMPRGGKRVAWNAMMLVALAVVTPGSIWIFWNKSEVLFGSPWIGMAALAAVLLLALIAHLAHKRKAREGGKAA